MNGYILALDQGTTSSRAILFDTSGNAVIKAQYPLSRSTPGPAGWSMTRRRSWPPSSTPWRRSMKRAA